MSDPNPASDDLSEEEVAVSIRRSLEELKEQGIDSRGFTPILLDRQTGLIIDGNTRLKIDGSWPVIEVELSPTQVEIVKFQLNFARRRMKREEITEGLSRIAELTGWSPQEIAENLGLKPMFVYRYLPRKYKNKRGRQPGQTPYYHGHIKRERTIKELEAKLEATEEKLVEVIIEQPEKVKSKSPEQTALAVYAQFPMAPLRYVQAALRRSHPGLTEDERKKIAESLRPEQPDSRLQTPLGYSCPFCDHWLRDSSVHRALNTLKKRDPELVEVMLIRLRRQGWED